mgnify:CR=1 FL=1
MHAFLGITPLVIGYMSSRLTIIIIIVVVTVIIVIIVIITICCFVQGVGGTVHLPKGFLKAAYELIRERGGVCIADEVLHLIKC